MLTRRKVIRTGLFGAGAFALVGCISPKSVTRNIRVIAQAEVAGKVVEGSAVMSLRWKAGDGTKMYNSSNAEAVVLDLDGRGTVYVLNAWGQVNGSINIGYWHSLVRKTFGIKGNGKLSDFPKIEALQGRYAVRPIVGDGRLPIMASFTDEAKFETAFEVKPDDFPTLFGEDVRFLGMWFELTDDPETSIIPERLPIAVKLNASFWDAFPKRGADGKLISGKDYAFPQKMGPTPFFYRGF